MDYQKALKKSILFFLPNPAPFNGQSYQKQKGIGTSGQSPFRLQNNFRKIPLLVIYYLTKFDDIILGSFWVIPKFTSADLCKPIHEIINYSTSICSSVSAKCGKEKITKLWISQEQKESFRWKKKLFIVFVGLQFGEKIKIW